MLRTALVMIALSLGLSACASSRYYVQAAAGQWQVLRARQDLGELIARADTEPKLQQRLQRLAQARDWAVQALGLPDNGSYRSYVALPRDYVLWNVYATPELSLAPLQHCFPIAGCVAYQGWYHESAARAHAQALATQGYDVDVGGVPAYSTLGWFDDPVMSPMLRWDDATLIETLFHELAHQKLYVPGDTAFNESFAEFVGEEGLRQYRRQHPELPGNTQREQHRREFTQQVLARRNQLAALYASSLSEPMQRVLKAETLLGLQRDYEQRRDGDWQGERRYDAWFAQAPLNNARLLPFGLYDAGVPAFAALYAQSGSDWPRFYAQAAQLARLPAAQRAQALQALVAPAAP